MNFPDTARHFDPPPREFEDREGRTVSLRTYGGFDGENPRPPATDDTFEALVAMYLDFDQADRAQGIPPSTEEGVRSWLATVLAPDCVNVVAGADDRLVGHATLVPDAEEAYELAIFVLGEYQGAGIGTELITALLGAGIECGIERVRLTVERWNAPARHLYRKVGFESISSEGFELEMSIRLRPDGEPFDPDTSGDGD
jgi:ribosomal protein S18 acetylase RimI-like enzyme